MDVPNVSELLDYVFDEKDLSLKPELKEYKKLQRIMTVMIRFYQRGTNTKKQQLDQVLTDLGYMKVDEEMINEQIKVISEFPDFHPKKAEYLSGLKKELKQLQDARSEFIPKAEEWEKLHKWSEKIVEIVTWLGKQLEEYSNKQYGTSLEVDPTIGNLTVEQYKVYKRGLEEITYNLQESQDFFDASLDGRLNKYHQIEKTMIEAQLEMLKKFPEDSPRRIAIEEELQKDLDYVMDNMKENPEVTRHRERMRAMHQDFFDVLKWQREKMLRMPFDHPEMLSGDVEGLKKELEAKKGEDLDEAMNGQLVPKEDENASSGGCPVTGSTVGECPVGKTMPKDTVGECPVNGKGNKDFSIHRLF